MSFKKSIQNSNSRFMLDYDFSNPIAKVISCEITENGLETKLQCIHPMTPEKMIEGEKNIMRALNERG